MCRLIISIFLRNNSNHIFRKFQEKVVIFTLVIMHGFAVKTVVKGKNWAHTVPFQTEAGFYMHDKVSNVSVVSWKLCCSTDLEIVTETIYFCVHKEKLKKENGWENGREHK